MTNGQTIPWRRLFVEGAAIIASILLAFAIDAWWDDRQQRGSDIAHLQSVLDEFELHYVLLSEAMDSHRRTVDLGYELFSLLASDLSSEKRARTVEVIDQMFDFYRINAPLGSLQTATSSGAIARMRDVELASSIASWPTTIDDLLEEQDDAGSIIVLQHQALLGQKISLHEVYGHRLANPSARGMPDFVSGVARSTPPVSHLAVDYKDIHDDIAVRNGFLEIMMFGQAALAEATLASAKLEALTLRLESCLNEETC